MGSIFPRRKRWWIKFKLNDGRWKPTATRFRVDDPEGRREAARLLERIESMIRGPADVDDVSTITVEWYGRVWIDQRLLSPA